VNPDHDVSGIYDVGGGHVLDANAALAGEHHCPHNGHQGIKRAVLRVSDEAGSVERGGRICGEALR
jgi:hypothetical protein